MLPFAGEVKEVALVVRVHVAFRGRQPKPVPRFALAVSDGHRAPEGHAVFQGHVLHPIPCDPLALGVERFRLAGFHAESGGEHLRQQHQIRRFFLQHLVQLGGERRAICFRILPMQVGLQRDHTERVLGWGIRRCARLGWGNSRLRRGGDGPKFGHCLVNCAVFFGEAHADAGLHLAKRAHRNGGDAVVPCPAQRQVAVGLPRQEVVGDVQNLEVPAFGRLPGEGRAFEALKQPVALGLVDGPQFSQVGLGVFREQVPRQGLLERCAGREHVVLVHCSEFSRELGWGGHPANLPAGGVKELPKTSRHQGAIPKLRMPPRHRRFSPVVDHGPVHFVAQHPRVGAFHGVGQQVELVGREHLARGVVGAVEHHNAGACAHGLGKCLVVVQRHADHLGEVQFGDRGVEVVPRLLHNHFVSRLQKGRHGRVQHT